MAALERAKQHRPYRPGQILYSQGDPATGIFCIESGNVAVRMSTRDGNSRLLRLARAGETLGYAEFFSGAAYWTSAEALCPSTVCHVEGGPLRELLRSQPALVQRFTARMAHDLREADDSAIQQVHYTVRMRLASLLLSLKDRYARVEADGTMRLSLPMTRQDMAAMLGARPETVYRTIQEMQNENVVNFAGHDVIISDLDLLLDEIEGGPLSN